MALGWANVRTTLCGLRPLHKQAYQREGFLIVDELFSRDQMVAWKQVVTERLRALAKPRVDPSTGREVSAATTGVSVWMSEETPGVLLQGLCTGPLRRVLTTIMSRDVEFLSVKPVFKSANVNFASPWHQDYPYWGGTHKLSVWIALDDANKSNGCLRVVPRTHTSVLPHTTHSEAIAFDNRVEGVDENNAVDVELAAGSAVFFHDLLLHASHGNASGTDRFSLIPTYRDGAVRDDQCSVWPTARLISGASVNPGCA